ncbi:MAG TPA: tail fiber protein [Candidatus Omnitrophota bacterium]|nr:tail fiber protein [Candidatus Omnitrophota bacterium]
MSEIRLFTYDFPMTGWANCDGTLLPVAQNQALFVLISNTFGGNGTTNFALPDMRGRLGICQGVLPNTTSVYVRGQTGGTEAVQLTASQVPSHNHQMYASADTTSLATTNSNCYLGNAAQAPADPNAPNNLYTTEYVPVTLRADAVAQTGGNVGHNNCMPSIGLKFCIATLGIFPSRN